MESYVAWVGPGHSHAALMAGLTQAGGNSLESSFNHCYNSMTVTRFGRLGKFDYLCLLGRLGFADLLPDRRTSWVQRGLWPVHACYLVAGRMLVCVRPHLRTGSAIWMPCCRSVCR